jgi:16S rRNA (cytidine1402-2'-O)-methyltransferase
MPGTLYVVSTPIGNLDDITERALKTLRSVALVAAEDTRHTANLLNHFGIVTPTTSLHRHNEAQKNRLLLQKLAEGLDVALVSDAGTPLVADPGQRLIAAAAGEGIRVVPIPGPSAILTALAVSGFPADQFVFAGFAPSRSLDRKRWFQQLSTENRTVVYFEAPHRVRTSIAEAGQYLGERQICIGRELTKRFETVFRGTVNRLNDLSVPERGEFTIVLGPIDEKAVARPVASDSEILAYFGQIADSSTSKREAAAKTAHEFGLSTKYVYSLVERGKASSPSS